MVHRLHFLQHEFIGFNTRNTARQGHCNFIGWVAKFNIFVMEHSHKLLSGLNDQLLYVHEQDLEQASSSSTRGTQQ
jgi:hypothetical protein